MRTRTLARCHAASAPVSLSTLAHVHSSTHSRARYIRLRFCAQVPRTGKGQKKATPVHKDRFITKLFLRGDSVILVLRNPK